MPTQPESVIAGAGMAQLGAALLGGGRAKYAGMIIALTVADTPELRRAAQQWEELSAGLREHPQQVQESVKDVRWTETSAELFHQTVDTHANEVADKAGLPQSTADSMRTSADVLDFAGDLMFDVGAAILLAGTIYQLGRVNPYFRPAAEVAATMFGRRADQQAGQGAIKLQTFLRGTEGVVGKIAGRFAKVSPAKKLIFGGATAVGGGMVASSAVAGDISGSALPQGNQQIKGA
ncbi:hypothetical protein [Nonomuraea sp. NEAU-A123]|uniref:hypothetical protein n=1 Tax=Nonomuraea sp. NEAU-A123 TaxID=2839649 RepID=UPI001BE40387|nr:hypothetical protein [Nonomuraea sp. NEAU-A123]MBT2230308.1 hypothetical protein [Nonomuraea sp. NEAU-A123]